MTRDWKEQLRTFQKAQDQEQLRALFESDQFRAVVEKLSLPKTDEERQMVDDCYYHLMKEACAERKTEAALDYAKKIAQSSYSSRARRSLVQERLTLLRHEPPEYETAPIERFAPGLVHIDTFSPIPVLGRYGTRGRKGTLNDLIRLLKKAPQELDNREERTRPLTINRIGYTLFKVLHSCNLLHQIDLILPIPADAERYSIRGYNQQGEIARVLSAYSAIPMHTSLLQKIRLTRSIHTLSSAAERESELAGSMNVPEDKRFLLERLVVLLIDDVVTYGTHFKEARKTLLEAGAQHVFAAAVAAACEYTQLDLQVFP
jgi:hypothetical protein